MPILTLVRGIPGSGKTTFVKKNFDCFHLETDMFFIKNKKYMFKGNLLSLAHSGCFNIATQVMGTGCDIVISNTFTQISEMDKYLTIAKKHGYFVEVYRMKNNFNSVHNVPDYTIQAMKNRFEDFSGEIYVSSQE